MWRLGGKKGIIGVGNSDSEINWAAGIFTDVFVAFFYSGLGCALALAGVVFLRNYIVYNRLLGKETETV